MLWGFPRFTPSDRDLFFALTATEREALEQRRSIRLPGRVLHAMIEAFELGEPLPTLAVSTALIPVRSKRYVLEPEGTIIFDMIERVDIDTLLLFVGANEQESHFVFDILFNNATDILPAIHFTDTHGTNHVLTVWAKNTKVLGPFWTPFTSRAFISLKIP